MSNYEYSETCKFINQCKTQKISIILVYMVIIFRISKYKNIFRVCIQYFFCTPKNGKFACKLDLNKPDLKTKLL